MRPESTPHEPSDTPLAPTQARERIVALDVIRGFALLGIFLMNIEWFNRPISELGRGIDPSLHGADFAVSWLVYVLVQSKFWTLFSLLFGIGFAVMLGRAEERGSNFAKPYVRRIIGLFLFGAMHFILIWTGDILHNYAITALALLLIVTRSWKAWLGIVVSLIAVGVALKVQALPMLLIFSALVALMMFFFHRKNATPARYWKWGVTIYSLPFVFSLIVAGVFAGFPNLKLAEKPDEAKQRIERIEKREKERVEEIRLDTQGTYPEAVVARAKKFAEDMPQATSLSFMALPMFLIGFWFVRSGIVARLRENAGLFKCLAAWTLPLGLLLSVGSTFLAPVIATQGGGGMPPPPRMAAFAFFQLGALALCIGYFAAMVVALNTRLGARWLSPLQYAGRMALTNYLMASVISSLFFFGYGLGYWGQVSRVGQMEFVAVVFAAQLGFSYLWLRYFRYGPMEWLWRAFTYWTLPPMRRRAGDAVEATAYAAP